MRRIHIIGVCLVIISALAVVVRAVPRHIETIQFEQAQMIIEFNSTAEDAGIQILLDGDPWKSLKVISPNGQTILDIAGKGNLKELGLTELFFESDEPPLSEQPLDEFLAKFPEGEYRLVAKTVDGANETGTAVLTHAIPQGPQILQPITGALVNPHHAMISWAAVPNPPGSTIVSYQVIVERENPHREFNVVLPTQNRSVTVPEEFLDTSTHYLFEVLAIEEGGNQTISEGSFTTSSK